MNEVLERRGEFKDTLEEISNYIFTSKYARYNKEAGRRESWDEAVGRVETMHLNKFKELPEEILDEIRWAFDMVRDKRSLPSMRAMQFGGAAVEAHNARIYNCAVRHIDSLRAFSEAFYLLLCGCGVGFGLTYKYLDRLPDLVSAEDKTGIVMTYVVEDNIEGWADSVEALLMCYFKDTPFSGRKIVFDYSRVREKGSELKTGGGKAPGHEGLKAAHIKIKALLDRIIEEDGQNRLYSIDAYDILMHQSDAVLSGGIRRSACAALFDKDDERMLNAKTGNWFEENPQRGRSNNSAILLRDKVTREEFGAVMERTKEWGEPGFVFAETEDVLYNPCFEVSFVPVTDDGVCGVQFCNLTTVNGAKVKTEEDFYEAVRAAAIIGTLQASYTDFKYLSNTAKKLTEAEALLGVSITGMMENPDIILDPRVQRIGARIVKDVNQWLAPIIGINPSPRSCVIKPEGSSSLAVGSMCSGIHAAHDRVMIRRVQANAMDNAYQHFKWYNPHLCEPSKWSSNGTDDVISFPIALDDKVMLKKDLTALKHLEIIKSTQRNWVIEGTSRFNTKPIHHNVSCTVSVGEHEWDGVTQYLYDNRKDFAAVALVAATSDKDYVQAPNESVVTKEEQEKFIKDMHLLSKVDWSLMVEDTDNTSLMQELSCAGPEGCEVK